MTEFFTSSLPGKLGLVLRLALAMGATVGLLLFLAGLRLSQSNSAPTLTLRTLDRIEPVSLPAPPPPQLETSPPPPVTKELPRLEIALDPIAPPIKARVEQELDFRLPRTDFAPQVEQARQEMTFASRDLDSHPKLISRPNVSYPDSLKDKGVLEGKVTLEVLISSAGSVNVRRTLDSSHTELVAMARSFASRSKFSPPQKDGRPVNALFQWPLILRP